MKKSDQRLLREIREAYKATSEMGSQKGRDLMLHIKDCLVRKAVARGIIDEDVPVPAPLSAPKDVAPPDNVLSFEVTVELTADEDANRQRLRDAWALKELEMSQKWGLEYTAEDLSRNFSRSGISIIMTADGHANRQRFRDAWEERVRETFDAGYLKPFQSPPNEGAAMRMPTAEELGPSINVKG